jgi:hypothetical protein
MIFALLIGFASAVVLVGALFKYEEVSEALRDSYPSEFQKEPLWRTAFPIFVLSPLTPLHLQVGYLQAMAGICFVTLGISLYCFLLDKEIAGWIVLAMFSLYSAMMISWWRTYKANSSRKRMQDPKEEL